MARLTKKDFEATASIIRGITKESTRITEREAAITRFIKANPCFDQERFRELCTPGAQKRNALALPPDVSYVFKVDVDTSRWWDREVTSQWDELHAVTYKGVRYVIDSDECRWTRRYAKGHAWAGQHELSGIDTRHVFEQFTGIEGKYGCGKSGGSGPGGWKPDYTLKDFISDFLFNVEHAEECEACSVYEVRMTYEVKIENREKFEKSLAFMADVIRNCKFEFSKDQPPSED